MTYKLAVIGNPIEHSLSPRLFELFAKSTKVDLEYHKILAINKEDFTLKVHNFFDMGGLFLNITSPFKHEAYLIANEYSYITNYTKTANTLYFNNNKIYADSTDGRGLYNDMVLNHKIDLTDKKVLIIGSGYVVESIIPELQTKYIKNLAIIGRNLIRVEYINDKYKLNKYSESIIYDIAINTTINNINNQIYSLIIKNISDNTIIYDMTYNYLTDNYLIKLLNNYKIYPKYIDGIGMLIEQGKINFQRFFNICPRIDKSMVIT